MNYKASIIIPTFNRCDLLDKALISLVKQTFNPSEFEIIVVDNGSTDNTREIVQQHIDENTAPYIHYIFDDIPGLLTGRHRGAKESNSDILCFIDEDIEADPDWLKEVYNTFKDSSVHLVGGKCLPIYDVEPPVWEKKLWSITGDHKMCGFYSLIDQGDEQKDCEPNLIWGLFFCIRKETLHKAGGFHPDALPGHLLRFLGDGETGLTTKIKSLGLRSVYQPKAVLYHHVTRERFGVEYLKKREFYQGCCNSYRDIRENNGFRNNKKIDGFLEKNRFKMIFHSLKKLVRNLLQFLGLCNKKTITEFDLILMEMQKAYKDGYAFHQNEAKNDPELLNWILKENYFDYKLPNM
jgi:glycosyltransferase involved in cell wall biosynthesis